MRGRLSAMLWVAVAACTYERAPFDPDLTDAMVIDAVDAIVVEVDAPAPDASVPTAVMAIAAGGAHSCAVLDNGAVRCWGSGASGVLGYGNTTTIGDDETPKSVGDVRVGGVVVKIAAGAEHTCALLESGAIRCWGRGLEGRLGYANTLDVGDNETPSMVGDVAVGGQAMDVTAGSHHTCALIAGAMVRCWGAGGSGQLGYGNTNDIGDDELPASVSIVDVGLPVAAIVAGDFHTCALTITGTVRCWGSGRFGQLGYGSMGTVGDNELPSAAGNVNVGGAVMQLAAGAEHTCALLFSGGVRCWGHNTYGQLGYGNTNDIGDNEAPVSAGDVLVGGTVTQIAAAGYHTCARLNTGGIRCWGNGASGRLGYANIMNIGDTEIPSSVGDILVGGGPARDLAAGGAHTCALSSLGAMRCWGAAGSGQLGHGDINNIGDNETPAAVGDISVF